LRADIGGHVEMSRPYVSLQSLMLSEALVASLIASASESLGAFVDGGMSSESGGSDEGFSTARLLTGVFLLVCMRALDMLGQVLFLEVILAAAFIWATKCSVVSVGS
jgi:hypothetical protein